MTAAPRTDRTHPRVRLTREKRREHLLDVAAQLIQTEGVAAVTMEGVALAAGVSKGLGYAYFDNRDELLVALFDREVGDVDRTIAARMAAEPTFEGKVRASLDAWFDELKQRGTLLGALLRVRTQGALEARRRDRQHAIEELWAQLVIDEYDVPRDQALVAATILLTGATSLIDFWLSRRVRRRELIATHVTVTVGALRALADATRRPDVGTTGTVTPA